MFPDEDGFFSCAIRDSSFSYWRLNGTDYDNLPSDVQDDLNISSFSTTQAEYIELIIIAKAEYNETEVECVAGSNDGESVKVSNTAMLYIQGN